MARRRTLLRAMGSFMLSLLLAADEEAIVNANGECDERLKVRRIVMLGEHILDVVLEPLVERGLELVIRIPTKSRDNLPELAGVVCCRGGLPEFHKSVDVSPFLIGVEEGVLKELLDCIPSEDHGSIQCSL